MDRIKPKIPKNLSRIDEFSSYVQSFLADELPVTAIRCCSGKAENQDFFRLELRTSVLENCISQNCNFEKASFVDVVFQSCDFSNSKFFGAYFERCRFVSCKCMGVDMRDTVFKHTIFEESNFQYSNFDETIMKDVFFEQIDFSECSIAGAKITRFQTKDSRFIKNNFFKTLLANIDFTENELLAPMVSSPAVELKGMIINVYQAADLIGIWGVTVKR